MATITNSIGTASRDYNTIALWEASLPVSAVTAGNSYVGQCYNDSEFDLGTTQLVIGGTTTDATHTILLTTGPGQSFRDNAGAPTNGLRYNPSNGVAIKGNLGYSPLITVSDANVALRGLQIQNSSNTGNNNAISVTGANFAADGCFFRNGGNGSFGAVIWFQNTFALTNCVLVADTSNALAPGVIWGATGSFINCDLVKPSNRTANGTAILYPYSTAASTLQNSVVAGFGAVASGGGLASLSGSGNATDLGSFPSGITGQVSLVIATEFVQPSNASSVMDWRLNSSSVACKDNGTNSGAPTTDIIGQAISNSIRDVGCWELQQSGGGGGGAVSHRLSLMGAGA